MTAEEGTDAAERPVQGPGARLRKVRESQGLERSRVAAQLHLSEQMIEALEQDDYQALPGAVFIQGYLRNYARLLDIPADEVLAAYRQLCPEEECDDLPEGHGGPIAPEVRSSHGVVRLVTWLIAIGLLGLLLIWWQGRLDWQLDAPTQVVEPERLDSEPAQAPAPVFGSAMEAPAELTRPQEARDDTPSTEMEKQGLSPETATGGVFGDPGLPEPGDGLVPQTQESGATPASGPDGELSPSEPSVSGSDGELSPSEPPAPLPASEPKVPSTAPAGMGHRLVFEFSGPCWAEVRDSTGRARIIGEMHAGSRRELDAGLGPFKVVLGNADAVRVTLAGKPYDLAPHTRGKVARFTLPASGH